MQVFQILRRLTGLSLLMIGACASPASAQPAELPDEDPAWPRTEFTISESTTGTKGFNTQPARKEDWPFFAALRGTREGVVTYD